MRSERKRVNLDSKECVARIAQLRQGLWMTFSSVSSLRRTTKEVVKTMSQEESKAASITAHPSDRREST